MNLSVMQDGSERIHYHNPRIPIYVSHGDLAGLSGMSALCHWHDDVELLLPLKGYLSYSVGGRQIHIQEGNAIFVNTRQMHYGFSADGTDCQYLCVTFRPGMLGFCEEVRNRYILPILSSPTFPYYVLRKSIPEHRPLLSALMRVESLWKEQAPGFELLVMASLLTFWQGLYSLVQDGIGDAVSADPNLQILKQILEFIRTHYAEKLTLDSIAASGGVCRTRCCQLFRKYLGRTPNDYLNSFRLETGMELLRSTTLSVTEIANACGYGSASYFTELFTKLKGCSPTAFRRQ